MCPKVVIISNHPTEHKKLEHLLVQEGYEVFQLSAINAKNVALIDNIAPQIILLEMDLGAYDGIEVCYQLKIEKKIDAFIVINSTQEEDYVQIEAFKAGADDYIIKPISNRVLLKKIQALLNRSSQKTIYNNIKGTLMHNDIVVDIDEYAVYKGQQKIELPRKEFEILCLLFKNPRKVFSRDNIYQSVWENTENLNPRIIDVHIRKIREKIGDEIIHTIKGVGYQLAK